MKFLSARYPAWQTEQAIKAVSIYMSFIRKENEKNPCQKKTADNTSWKNVMQTTQKELRLQNKSLQTERSYLYWTKDFRRYSDSVSPEILGRNDVKAFLTYLAVERPMAIATQKQAFNAILFFFRYILDRPIIDLHSVIRSKKPRRLPLVLSAKEIFELFRRMEHSYKLMSEIIFWGGLRLSECLRLRVNDVDIRSASWA